MSDRSPEESRPASEPAASAGASSADAGGTDENGGLSPIAWIAIGCGTILILTAVILGVGGYFIYDTARDAVQEFQEDPTLAAARTFVRMNPDLEIVDTDEDERKITIRNVETGEEMTFDLQEVAEGRIDFETEEGRVEMRVEEGDEEGTVEIETEEGTARFGSDVSDVPDWVPLYPGGDVRPGYTAVGDRGEAGTLEIVTEDGVGDVVDYYRESLEAADFTIDQEGTTRAGETTTGTLIATSKEPERNVQISVQGTDAETRIVLIYKGSPE